MKQNISILSLTVVATAAITTNTLVTIGGAVAAAAGTALGVADTAAAIGQAVSVSVVGTALVTAGAAIAAGAAVEVGAAGSAVTRVTGVTVGRALSAAAAAGDLVEILLIAN